MAFLYVHLGVCLGEALRVPCRASKEVKRSVMFEFIARVVDVASTHLWGGKFLKSLEQEFDLDKPDTVTVGEYFDYKIVWHGTSSGSKLEALYNVGSTFGCYTLTIDKKEFEINDIYNGCLYRYSKRAVKAHRRAIKGSKEKDLEELGFSGYISKKGEVW